MDLECAVCLDLLSEDPSAEKSKDSSAACPPPTKKARRSSNRLSQQSGETSSHQTRCPPSQPSTSTATTLLDKSYLCVTKCGHAFHKSCLIDWMQKSETCPSCNASITMKDLGPLYLPISSENKKCKQCQQTDAKVASLKQEVDGLKKSLERENSVLKLKIEERLAVNRALNKQLTDLKVKNANAMTDLKLQQDKVEEQTKRINGLVVENEGFKLAMQNIETQRKLDEKSLSKTNKFLEQKQKKEKEQLEWRQASGEMKLRSSGSGNCNSKSSSRAQPASQNIIIIDSSSDDDY